MKTLFFIATLFFLTSGYSQEVKEQPKDSSNIFKVLNERLRSPYAPKAEEVAKLKKEVQELFLLRDRLKAENAILQEKLKRETAEITAEEHRIKARNKLATEKANQERLALKLEKDHLQLEYDIVKMKHDKAYNEYKLKEIEWKTRTAELTAEIGEIEKEQERRFYANQKPIYLENPLVGNTLIISDRRIPLNGAITSKTADFISERINFFNNQDKKLPIFIVIDRSPGGSVMSGYKILQAMKSSEAPVYVVIKSYAASMAAAVATLAEKSFAYPNAIVLHHQMSSSAYGNVTEMREQLKLVEEWWKRFGEPIAQKMNISRAEFIKKMYEKNSTGNWEEFADKAQELKWVDVIVEEMQETSLLKHPDAKKYSSPSRPPRRAEEPIEDPYAYDLGIQEAFDKEGKAYRKLPPLDPFDFYFLYDPNNRYRVD